MRLFYFAGFDLGASECGRTSHVEGIVRGLHKLGWEITLFSCKDAGDAKQPSFPFASILINRRSGALKHQIMDQVRLAWRMLRWKGGKPDVIYIRNRFSMLVPVFYALIHKIPYFYEVNGLKEFETAHQFFLSMALKTENWVLRHSRGIFPVTEELRNHFLKRTGLSESRFVVIPNGADTSIWSEEIKSSVRRSDKELTIGFVGQFAARHGVETVIWALPLVRQELGDVRFVVAGSGPEESQYKFLAERLGVSEYVHLPGYIPKDKLGSLLAGFDVTVAPYTAEFAKTGTGLSPLKIFTYLVCERVVVASDLTGLLDLPGPMMLRISLALSLKFCR